MLKSAASYLTLIVILMISMAGCDLSDAPNNQQVTVSGNPSGAQNFNFEGKTIKTAMPIALSEVSIIDANTTTYKTIDEYTITLSFGELQADNTGTVDITIESRFTSDADTTTPIYTYYGPISSYAAYYALTGFNGQIESSNIYKGTYKKIVIPVSEATNQTQFYRISFTRFDKTICTASYTGSGIISDPYVLAYVAPTVTSTINFDTGNMEYYDMPYTVLDKDVATNKQNIKITIPLPGYPAYPSLSFGFGYGAGSSSTNNYFIEQ